MVTATRMTLDEFLGLPETEPPAEFVCGRIVQKPMPTWDHSSLAARIAAFFTLYFMRNREGFVNTELRHAERSEDRAYLPDVSVTRREHAPKSRQERQRGPIEHVPDIAIEVVSPDDRPGRLAERVAFYLRAGVPLVWVVEPDERTISVFEPGRPARILGVEDTIDAAPVLSSFSMALDELFAVLDDGVDED
jgi:Uma2 family endonuclease